MHKKCSQAQNSLIKTLHNFPYVYIKHQNILLERRYAVNLFMKCQNHN